PRAWVEPMDGHDIETVVRCLVAHRDVQGMVVLLHAHVQTCGEGLGSRALLDAVSLGPYPYGLRSCPAAFLGPQKGMGAPRDTSGAGCGSHNSDSKRHVSYIGSRIPEAEHVWKVRPMHVKVRHAATKNPPEEAGLVWLK